MNRIKKVSRPAASLLALLLCVTLLASTAFAAGGALGADRNGTPYTYVIGYMYSGSSQTVNTREIFTSPNNYDIWLCPVCGRDPLGNSQGTALAPNLYMPCYGYDIAAAGGDMSIRYALVRHRHNNGQLSDDRVYIPVNVPMYAGCYYGYDLTEPAGVQVSAPTGWQRDSAVVRFSGGTDTGTSLPDWSAAPGDYGSGVPFPVSWTVKMKKKQKETQDILSYHTQAAGCSDKARAKASGGRQPIEECGRTGL